MTKTSVAIVVLIAAGTARFAPASTEVNSTKLNDTNPYSDPQAWSPAKVPNNSPTETFNVTAPFPVQLDMDATVSNITLEAEFQADGHSYTVLGSTTLGSGASLTVASDLAGNAAIFSAGELTNFDPASHTLQSGLYAVNGSSSKQNAVNFQFNGADIMANACDINLASGGRIIDEQGRDALRNFSHNLAFGTFVISDDQYTIGTVFTNDGMVVTHGASFIVSGGLTNYDSSSHTLRGGQYYILSEREDGYPPSSFGFGGADIVHNAAFLRLESTPGITDEKGNNGLRNFADNESTGTFELNLPAGFTGSSDFTNEGTVMLYESVFALPTGHTYRQSAGETDIHYARLNSNVEIDGGILSAVSSQGLINIHNAGGVAVIGGNLTMTAGLLNQPTQLMVNGSATFSGTARWEYYVDVTNNTPEALDVSETLTLGGTLEIDYSNPFPPGSMTQFPLAKAKTIIGSFANADANARVATKNGAGSFAVVANNGSLVLTDYHRTQPAAQLLNISTRAQVLAGDDAAIGGFIVVGTDSKTLLIRGLGPSLVAQGLPGALQDPTLELHDGSAVIATNDNWTETQSVAISQTGVAPSDARESAILITLHPGAYTVVLRGTNESTGIGLLEIYDLSPDVKSRLANISTRGFVDADHVLIGGAIVGGSGKGDAELVVRGIGSQLKNRGVSDFLPDPALEVRDSNGTLVAANDDFAKPLQNIDTMPFSLAPADPDAATGIKVPPGRYTVIVRGNNGASGTALVEIYDLND